MKRLSLALGLATGTLFFGAPAWACSNPQSVRAIIHSALPRPLPANTVVADVELGSGDVDVLHRTGIRARIRTLVQGRSSGRHLILRLPAGSTCDHPFANGRAGFIVAVPRRRDGGMLVVTPLPVSRQSGFRLPDGYQLPARPIPE